MNKVANILLMVLALLFSLLTCEAAFRVIQGEKVFALTNFRETKIAREELSQGLKYDAQLEWK